MILKRIKDKWDRLSRQDWNDNMTIIEKNFNNVVNVVSDQAYNQVVESATLIWKEPVNTFSGLVQTYPNPEVGWTVMVREVVTGFDGKGVNKVYRYNGSEWTEIQQILADAVNEVDHRLTSQLVHIDEIKAEKTVVTTQLATKVSHDYFDSYMASVVDWAPKGAYTTLSALQTAYPNGTSGVFLVQENGHAYSWVNNEWSDLGVYQASQIADDSITNAQLKDVTGGLGKNLFNKYSYEAGRYIDGAGNLIIGGASTTGINSLSSFFTVKPDTFYKPSHVVVMVFYDENFTKINQLNGDVARKTPANCRYVRLSFNENDKETLQFEEGFETTTYEEWKFTLVGLKVTDLVNETVKPQHFANKFGTGKNLFNKNDGESDVYIDGSGNTQTGTSGSGLNSLSAFMIVEPNTKYARNHQCIVVFYDINNQQISVSTYWTDAVTTPTNCYLAKLSYKSTDRSTLQFEKGSKPTEYEEWKFGLEGMTVQGLSDVQLDMREVQTRNLDRPLYIRPMLDVVTSHVSRLQTVSTLSFGFVTDTHTPENSIIAMRQIAEMSKYVPIRYIAHGGDIIDGFTPPQNGLAEIRQAMYWANDKRIVPWVFVKGDHDDNNFYARLSQYGGSGTKLSSDFIKNTELYNVTTKFSENELVIGSRERMYYYIDDEASNIRTIFLNSNDIPDTSTGGVKDYDCFNYKGYSNAQLNWIAHTALDFSSKENPNDWGVITISHVLGDITTVPNQSPLRAILTAFKTGTSYSRVNPAPLDGFIANPAWAYDIDVDFTDRQGEFIAFIGGHQHEDKNVVTDGFLSISTLNASLAKDHSSAPVKTPGTATETAWDIYTIDRVARKIYTTRFGAGVDRVISY